MSADIVSPFEPHMTLLEVKKLKTGDKIDHRYIDGKFMAATIILANLSTNTFRIHYDDTNAALDIDSDPITEFHRFAKYRSISQRPAHRSIHAHKGMFVDVNNFIMHPGWRKAEIIATDKIYNSGQIKVQYKYGRQEAVKWTTWVHRDNVNEVDKYGVHSAIKTIEHLPISLDANRSYLNTPNEIKGCCTEEIIDTVYGGMSNLLSHLIENASTSELQQIHQIMKNKTIKYQEAVKATNKANKNKNANNNINDDVSINSTGKPTISSLSELSRDCIDYICSYLNREDIKSFKLTSYRNGIVCLLQMTKCTVSIENVNGIINPSNPDYIDMVGIKKSKTFHRYPANTKYLTLRQKWEEKFEIPLSKQFIFRNNVEITTGFSIERNDNDTNNELIKTKPNLDFVLFDTRNTIIFNKNGDPAKRIQPDNDLKKEIQKLQLLLIKYFDIFSQKMVPLQILMGEHEVMTIRRLTKYFQHKFIVTTPEQKMWHSKIVASFDEMNKIAPYDEKLIVYTEKKNKIYPAINPIGIIKPSFWGICIFQLNPKHPIFSKCKFPLIPEKYELLTQ